MNIHCTFYPQAWINDNALDVDPEGTMTWEMDMLEVVELTGVSDLNCMDDNPYARDKLRHSKKAPQWIKDWTGPFEIECKVKGFQ